MVVLKLSITFSPSQTEFCRIALHVKHLLRVLIVIYLLYINISEKWLLFLIDQALTGLNIISICFYMLGKAHSIRVRRLSCFIVGPAIPLNFAVFIDVPLCPVRIDLTPTLIVRRKLFLKLTVVILVLVDCQARWQPHAYRGVIIWMTNT